jgi:CHAT domain-containing protein
LEGTLENSLLAVAPVFSDPEGSMIWSEGYVFDTTYQHGESLRSAVVADGSRFQPIKHTESEVASITALFNKNGKSTVVFLFDRATEEHFKEAAPLSRILHLATHSFIDEANPRLSGIAFTQPNEMEVGGDGILYAPEIASLNLEGVDLVVLSHFESGAWRSGPKEGAFSLSHAFLNAGAGRVVHSLWKVYAPYANRLMLPFYEAVLDGQSYDKALQAAKIKMTRNKETADPGIWSGFLLIE